MEVQAKEARVCVVSDSFPQRGRRQGWEESGQGDGCGMRQEQGHADLVIEFTDIN